MHPTSAAAYQIVLASYPSFLPSTRLGREGNFRTHLHVYLPSHFPTHQSKPPHLNGLERSLFSGLTSLGIFRPVPSRQVRDQRKKTSKIVLGFVGFATKTGPDWTGPDDTIGKEQMGEMQKRSNEP